MTRGCILATALPNLPLKVETQVGDARRFHPSHQLFSNAEKEIRRVIISVVQVHGTEEGSQCHQGHKTTPEYVQNSYESLVKNVCLGAEMFKNVTNGVVDHCSLATLEEQRWHVLRNLFSSLLLSWTATHSKHYLALFDIYRIFNTQLLIVNIWRLSEWRIGGGWCGKLGGGAGPHPNGLHIWGPYSPTLQTLTLTIFKGQKGNQSGSHEWCFRFTAQRKSQTTTRAIITLPLEMPTTPMKTVTNKCAWGPKCLRIRPESDYTRPIHVFGGRPAADGLWGHGQRLAPSWSSR